MPDEQWDRIQSLYHQALKLSSEERRAFLANAVPETTVYSVRLKPSSVPLNTTADLWKNLLAMRPYS